MTIVKKSIVLCADDYGLNPGVSEGIRLLVARSRLNAVSCLVNFPNLKQEASALLQLRSNAMLGLHFNLTEGCFLTNKKKSLPSLRSLLIKSHMRLLNKKLITEEFEAQLDTFIAVFNKIPDFIDGHQHVHQLPIIRDCILNVYQKRFKLKQVLIRSTTPQVILPEFKFKAWIIQLTGAKALQKQLIRLDIPHNQTFGGVYDFSTTRNYRDLFKRWILTASDDTLIMCHPGLSSDDSDSIARSRDNEFTYFNSDEFMTDRSHQN